MLEKTGDEYVYILPGPRRYLEHALESRSRQRGNGGAAELMMEEKAARSTKFPRGHARVDSAWPGGSSHKKKEKKKRRIRCVTCNLQSVEKENLLGRKS